MKAYGGVKTGLHAFLNLAVGGGEWSASRPDGFNPNKMAPDTYCIGGCVGSRPGVDAVK